MTLGPERMLPGLGVRNFSNTCGRPECMSGFPRYIAQPRLQTRLIAGKVVIFMYICRELGCFGNF